MLEAKMEEKHAQAEYEELMQDSAAQRTENSKSLTDKEAALADVKVELERHMSTKHSAEKDLEAVEKAVIAVHSDCDFLLKYFEPRKEARADEIEALRKEKAIL